MHRLYSDDGVQENHLVVEDPLIRRCLPHVATLEMEHFEDDKDNEDEG